jgi:indolepyruvate ferredoxin oxidoreductase alpha subunit
MAVEILLGNEAIALGLVEQGCRVATAYPGTPSSEILAGVVKYKRLHEQEIHTEWSTNEKVAYEVALAASWTGLRAAVAMKQVGLNVASDPLFSSAYTGVKGGFIVIPADDPGPHSSQTEQDSRLMALNAKIPVFDPSSPQEARSMVQAAFALSEEFGIPTMLRPTTRVCHALQGIAVEPTSGSNGTPSKARFRKDPLHWTATPKLRYRLHIELNEKLRQIEDRFAASDLNYILNEDSSDRVGLIASGAAFETARQALVELGASIPILKIGTPFPLPQQLVGEFLSGLDMVVVLEEPDACIELQLPEQIGVFGRRNGLVPGAGELTPEVVSAVLAEALEAAGFEVSPPPDDPALQAAIDSLELPIRGPRLCPGCSHRSAFFALKREFGPRAIYPGDIGCYTLGTNLRAVDTFVDMGAAVSMADGLYQAGKLVGDSRPIIASIGDSTFIHSGIVPLINAVHTGSRFVLIILDNHTTAMTGFQPTAEAGDLADGTPAPHAASIPELVRACGVQFVEVTDPYDQETFRQTVRSAYDHSQSADGGVAVVIADRPCVLYDPVSVQEHPIPVVITEECDGCRFCTEAFECPALVLRPDASRVDIDEKTCIDCGQCIDACYKGFILPAAIA